MENKDETLLVKYLNNKQVVKYLSSKIPRPYTLEDAKWWIDVGSKDHAIVKSIEFNGVFCGVIGVYKQQHEYSHCAEIGYWLAQEFWNKGITSKALVEFTNLVFSTTEITRLYGSVFSPNQLSMKVLEKSGYTLEGILKKAIYKDGEYYDGHLFANVKKGD